MKKLTLTRIINALLNRIPGVKSVRDMKRFDDVFAAWRDVSDGCEAIIKRGVMPKKILIVPSDPYTLIGARGDEAMLHSFIGLARNKYPDVLIGIVTASQEASNIARANQCIPLQIWSDQMVPRDVKNSLSEFAADMVVGVGADVMDGYYSSYNTLCFLIYADLAARLGSRVSYLGFSFNNHPAVELKKAYDAVDRNVRFNLRDDISFERFKKFCNAQACLVADVAFHLVPAAEDSHLIKLRSWIDSQRALKRTIIALNVHSMLIKNATQQQIDKLIDACTAAITGVSRQSSVSFVLLPHDFRGGLGDNVCLEPIAAKLKKASLDNYYHVEGAPSAALLKAMSGLVDGVITGRMHLAIAALGMGVPVLALTYQDKFHGLFKHFNLPDWLLLPPQTVLDVPEFINRIEAFLKEREALQAGVQQSIGMVRERSERNLNFH